MAESHIREAARNSYPMALPRPWFVPDVLGPFASDADGNVQASGSGSTSRDDAITTGVGFQYHRHVNEHEQDNLGGDESQEASDSEHDDKRLQEEVDDDDDDEGVEEEVIDEDDDEGVEEEVDDEAQGPEELLLDAQQEGGSLDYDELEQHQASQGHNLHVAPVSLVSHLAILWLLMYGRRCHF